MTDGWAEQGGAIPLSDGQQGDFQVKAQKFLNDHLGRCAAGIGHGGFPGLIKVLSPFHHALPFSGGAHDRLHHHRPAQRFRRLMELFRAGGVGESRRAQPEFSGGKIANAVPVHRHGGGPGCRDHGDAVVLQLCQCIHGQGFDFGNHHRWTVAANHLQESLRFCHRQHFRHVRHLHRWGVVVAITGDHPAAQALGCDRHFLAEFTTAQQHHRGGKGRHRLFRGSMV